jgi:DNA polymerase phi
MARTNKRKKQQQQQQAEAEAVKRKDADSEKKEEEDTDEMEVDDDDDHENEEEQEGVVPPDDDDDVDDDDDDDDMREPKPRPAASPPSTPRGSSSSSSSSLSSPFLDSFYGLSSDDPRERAVAGQALLHYSVTGPDANVQDASYTFKRLLNGLCSGRAAARQGNASALTAFLKLGYAAVEDDDDDDEHDGGDCGSLLLKIQKDELAKEQEKDGRSKELVSTLQYVRRRLINATDSTEGGTTRRKGSEERDHQFGRLFGILAVIRSGILLPKVTTDSNNNNYTNKNDKESEIISIASDLVQDLVELYQSKKWMREPAAHAVGTMLTMFYNHHTSSKPARQDGGSPSRSTSTSTTATSSSRVLHHLVETVIIPQLLVKSDNAVMEKKKQKQPHINDALSSSSSSTTSLALFSTYSAEQVALALMIQSHYSSMMDVPPAPLHVAVLSQETIPFVSPALVETSCVVQPRVHLVWDAIFVYLSQEQNSASSSSSSSSSTVQPAATASSSSNVSVRRPVPSLPIGGKEETTHDILDTLIQTVVVKGLLGGGKESIISEGDNTNTSNKATHERRSLALMLVRHMSGVEFVSSISGRMRLRLDAQTIETVIFCPTMVQLCFLNVVGAGTGFGGGGGKRQQGDHLLKPLALKVLEMVVESMTNEDSEECMELRLALFKALIRCDSRFDGHTKTSTIANLVGLNHVASVPASAMVAGDDASPITVLFKQQCVFWDNYIEYLQGQILLAELPANEGSSSSRNNTVTSSTASSFADLLLNLAKFMFRIPSDKDMDEYKSATIRRILAFFMTLAFFDCRNVAANSKKKHRRPVLQIALDVKDKRPSSLLPYDVRCVLSARFFSLLTEDVHAVLQSESQSSDKTISLDTIGSIVDDWTLLEESGAARLEHPGQDDGDDEEEEKSHP